MNDSSSLAWRRICDLFYFPKHSTFYSYIYYKISFFLIVNRIFAKNYASSPPVGDDFSPPINQYPS